MEVSFRTAYVCPDCDVEYRQDCIDCPDCGVELVERKLWRCAACGTDVESVVATCWSCSSALPDNVVQPATLEDERRCSAQLRWSITGSGQGTSEGESASANPARIAAREWEREPSASATPMLPRSAEGRAVNEVGPRHYVEQAIRGATKRPLHSDSQVVERSTGGEEL